jgi:hypothetical protein
MLGATMYTPTATVLVAILPHIRYEIEHCFCVPKHDQNDPHIRESVGLAILIHARLLVDFFEDAPPKGDDVLSSHFGYEASTIPMQQADRSRLNKDIAHLTYSRLRHTPATKRWPIEAIQLSLRPTVVKFVRHIINHPPTGTDEAELVAWRSLCEAFGRCA